MMRDDDARHLQLTQCHIEAGSLGSDGQLQAVIGRDHFDLFAAPADRLEPHSIVEDDLEHPIV